MAHAYSEDLPVRALDLIGSYVSISKVSRILKISRPTLYRWKKQLEEIGLTAPLKSVPPPQPSKIRDWDKFKEFVDTHTDKTQKELAQLWGNVSHNTIGRGFKKLDYTRKKKPMVIKNGVKKLFGEIRKKLAQYQPEQLIYVDKSAIDSNDTYPYGWCEKGKRLHCKRPGKPRERLSIIGALSEDKFLAPMVYQGYCTAKVIETWLDKFLLPQVRAGQVIIMDNAPFHNSTKIRELIEKAGCELLFLPGYSPDLNPIEHCWHQVKTAIRKELPKYDFNVQLAADAAFQYL